jgi:hypothetical protein
VLPGSTAADTTVNFDDLTAGGPFSKRRTGLEPATSSLGSLRSTN